MPRIISRASAWYEGRGARVFKARKSYECDLCSTLIQVVGIPTGEVYARLSTGLKACSAHIDPDDIVSVPTPSEASQ